MAGEAGEEAVAEEVQLLDPRPEYVLEAASGDVVAHGPVLDLLPHDCTFGADTRAEYSFDIRPLLCGYQGEALFCALRHYDLPNTTAEHTNSDTTTPSSTEEPTGAGLDEEASESMWAPLSCAEGILLSEDGMATVELQSFGRIMVIWLKGLEQLPAMIDLLAKGLLASLASTGQEADEAFRASFRLDCVAAVNIERMWNGTLKIQNLEDVSATIADQVSADVFETARRKEAAAVAAAEARRLEEEAAAAAVERVQSLPLLLHEAAKKGLEGWLGDAEANPENISMEAIMEEGVAAGLQLHLWQDKNGYTALYCATMYEQESAVKLLIDAGSEVDKANKNGVTPLMAAARDGYTGIVKLLLTAGADYNQVDEFGRTADSVADEKGFPETRDAVKEFAAAAAAK
jgi:rhodanese-related sulfurtransferase